MEVAKVTTKGIPQVTGLSFDHVVLYEKLPVENSDIFQNILTITKLLNKYDVIIHHAQHNNDAYFLPRIRDFRNIAVLFFLLPVNQHSLSSLQAPSNRLQYPDTLF